MPFPSGESTRLLADPDAQLMRITTTTTIERPAHEIWDLVGHRFADGSVWASSVDTSRAVGGQKLADAPCGARECRVAVPGADRLVEELVAYDNASMSLTYVVAEGMQLVARSARNIWSVTPLSDARSKLRIDAEIDLSLTGRILAPVLRSLSGGDGPAQRRRSQGVRADRRPQPPEAATAVRHRRPRRPCRRQRRLYHPVGRRAHDRLALVGSLVRLQFHNGGGAVEVLQRALAAATEDYGDRGDRGDRPEGPDPVTHRPAPHATGRAWVRPGSRPV